jgi:hypothetical protein
MRTPWCPEEIRHGNLADAETALEEKWAYAPHDAELLNNLFLLAPPRARHCDRCGRSGLLAPAGHDGVQERRLDSHGRLRKRSRTD